VSRASHAPVVNSDGEREIERYLVGERRASAWRLLRVGIGALLFGGLGTVGLHQWWVHGGVMPRVVFAAPFWSVVGAVLTACGGAAWARASSD